jgi:hypothetical protein
MLERMIVIISSTFVCTLDKHYTESPSNTIREIVMCEWV